MILFINFKKNIEIFINSPSYFGKGLKCMVIMLTVFIYMFVWLLLLLYYVYGVQLFVSVLNEGLFHTISSFVNLTSTNR